MQKGVPFYDDMSKLNQTDQDSSRNVGNQADTLFLQIEGTV